MAPDRFLLRGEPEGSHRKGPGLKVMSLGLDDSSAHWLIGWSPWPRGRHASLWLPPVSGQRTGIHMYQLEQNPMKLTVF